MDKTAQFNGTVSEILKKSDVDQAYNPKSENAQSGKAVASALGNYLPLDREIEIELDGGDAGGELEVEYIVDDAMSDTSSNPVENRVIKRYIDELNGKIINYPIEEGTVGIWNYTKWSNGKIELWTRDIVHTIDFVSAGAIYYSTQSDIEVPIVTKLEYVNGDVSHWHFANWSSVTISNKSNNAIEIRYYGTNSNGNGGKIPFSAYVIGRWK